MEDNFTFPERLILISSFTYPILCCRVFFQLISTRVWSSRYKRIIYQVLFISFFLASRIAVFNYCLHCCFSVTSSLENCTSQQISCGRNTYVDCNNHFFFTFLLFTVGLDQVKGRLTYLTVQGHASPI